MTPTPSRDEMLARLAKLRAANEAATSWGAAVGARSVEIRNLERRLAVSASDGSQKETPLAKQELPGADRSESETALRNALKNVQRIIAEGALTGFNCRDGDWADRLFASQQVTSRALKAVAETDAVQGQQGNEQSGKELSRAAEMLHIASTMILAHCPEETYFYDGTDCDGICIADDCLSARESLLELADTHRTDNAESTPPAVFSDPVCQPHESGER